VNISRTVQRRRVMGRDILCLYCEPWHTSLRTSKHHLMAHLAQHNRILYVEQPLHPFAVLRRSGGFAAQLARWSRGLHEVAPNIHSLLSAAPLPYHSAAPLTNQLWANTMNQRWVLPSLLRALKSLTFREVIVWQYYPHAAPILAHLKPALRLLHVIDDWQALPGLPASFAQLESMAATEADLVITSSQPLFDAKQSLNPNTHLVRHGADIDLFSRVGDPTLSIPRDVIDLPRPIVGYYGALHKLDGSLVRSLATRHSDWSFVFIGPTGGVQGADVSWANGMANVHVLGERRQNELPAYLKSFAAVLFPFRRDALTYSMCPIKAYECLAAGIPVVSVSIPEIDVLAPLVYAGLTVEDLDCLLNEAMRESVDRRAARIEFASHCSWSHRIAEIEQLVCEASDVARH
jgi:glycosyltransferase involved in cell wall biosynthesis